MEPDWYNFPDYLAAQFPELRAEIEDSYLEWLDGFRDPYPHVFLEEYIGEMLIGRGDYTPDVRRRAGEILDVVLRARDQDLAEAGLTAILEPLRDDEALREKAWPYLGEVAKEWLAKLS
ncbi:MAG TPA: hypothetical protein VNI54_14245 [Thermoanaerobaculia bacterium]|nr:hypothetical protein [Thermoanaerobaculia bacterium]